MDAGVLELALEQGRRLGVRDEALAEKSLHGDAPVRVREVPARGDDHDLVLVEQRGDEALSLEAHWDERELDLALAQLALGLAVRALPYVHLDLGVVRHEAPERPGQPHGHDARGRGDAHPPVLERVEAPHVPLEPGIGVADRPGIAEEPLAVGRERERRPASLEERDAPVGLEAAHGAAHGGLRHAELLARRREPPQAGGRHKRLDLVDVRVHGTFPRKKRGAQPRAVTRPKVTRPRSKGLGLFRERTQFGVGPQITGRP